MDHFYFLVLGYHKVHTLLPGKSNKDSVNMA